MPEESDDVEVTFTGLLDQLEAMAKSPSLGLSLGGRGLNSTLLLVAVQGLRAYVEGRKLEAAEDFETVAEEIRARAAPKE